MIARGAACALLAAGACTTTAPTIELIVDEPTGDPDATAIGIDGLAIAVAHAGNADDLVAQSFTPGASIDLSGVPFADDLVVHLVGRIGGDDVAYGRTCSFAFEPTGAAPTPHLFFARNVKFGDLGFTAFARAGGTALTYHDGSGIVVGGIGPDGNPVRAVERFDPHTGEPTNFATLDARTGAVAAVFGTGETSRIAVIGGATGASGAGFLELVEADKLGGTPIERIDDPAGMMARLGLTATSLTDGRVVVIGGAPPSGAPVANVAEVAEVVGAIEISSPAGATLAVPRVEHTATQLGTGVGAPVLVAGGRDGAGQPVAIAELYRPLSSDFADGAHFAPHMVVPRSQHQARLMPDGSVLFIGGVDAAGAPVRTLERFTFDAGFVAVGQLPATAGILGATATTLPDGRILLTGGVIPPATTPVDTAFIARLDVVDGSVDVVATDTMATPRAFHQAVLLCDGTVFLSGGTTTATSPVIAERYNPPATGRR